MTFFTSPNDGAPDQKPWTLYPTPVVLMPGVSRRNVEGEECGGKPRNLSDPHSFDPRRDMMPIVEAQRWKKDGWSIGSDASCIAGEIELTAVTRAGITHTTLHEYPDVVGQKAAA